MRAGEERVFDLDGVDREQYIAVNAQLGLDPESEAATAGVPRFHSGAAKPATGVFVAAKRPRSRLAREGPWPGQTRQSFDPQRVGQLEGVLWVAYYRREWMAFMRSAVFLIRHVFGLPWPSTARGSWFVLRATQLWAPCPDNDSRCGAGCDGAVLPSAQGTQRRAVRPAEAARLEVERWRVHREYQHNNADSDERPLVDALAELYSYVFGMPDTAVRRAAPSLLPPPAIR